MRKKASELVKGEWYADISSIHSNSTFLRYLESDGSNDIFDARKGFDSYMDYNNGNIGFISGLNWFLPTPEDIEKYNLNEKE